MQPSRALKKTTLHTTPARPANAVSKKRNVASCFYSCMNRMLTSPRAPPSGFPLSTLATEFVLPLSCRNGNVYKSPSEYKTLSQVQVVPGVCQGRRKFLGKMDRNRPTSREDADRTVLRVACTLGSCMTLEARSTTAPYT